MIGEMVMFFAYMRTVCLHTLSVTPFTVAASKMFDQWAFSRSVIPPIIHILYIGLRDLAKPINDYRESIHRYNCM